MSEPAALESRLAAVRARIATAAERVGRAASEVQLIGVSKRQPAEAVAAAVRAGLRDVGESFAQEARDKVPAVHALLEADGTPAPRWHFVGRLQRNKARLVVPHFQVVASVDRLSLAEELSRRSMAAGYTLEILLQVNSSGELQKGGVAPEDAAALLESTAALASIAVRGLMTVPAMSADPEDARPSFQLLRALRDDLSKRPGGENLQELSMGMSSDFEVGIEEGATQVRIGQAIFGPRA